MARFLHILFVERVCRGQDTVGLLPLLFSRNYDNSDAKNVYVVTACHKVYMQIGPGFHVLIGYPKHKATIATRF
jgi:hypothetical protein